MWPKPLRWLPDASAPIALLKTLKQLSGSFEHILLRTEVAGREGETLKSRHRVKVLLS